MIRSSAGSVLSVFLAALSISPALAAPHGSLVRAPHYPYKDYSSGHHNRRQIPNVPNGIESCALSAGQLAAPGDREIARNGVRYSQLCLQRLGFMLPSEERALCRADCSTCDVVRGYDIPCITEMVLERSAQGDLSKLQDTKQSKNLMAPTTAADCLVPPKKASLVPLAGNNWTPFTVVGDQVFDNDCLSRHYLDTLSHTASCPPNDNACMMDRALEPGHDDAHRDPGLPASQLPPAVPAPPVPAVPAPPVPAIPAVPAVPVPVVPDVPALPAVPAPPVPALPAPPEPAIPAPALPAIPAVPPSPDGPLPLPLPQ